MTPERKAGIRASHFRATSTEGWQGRVICGTCGRVNELGSFFDGTETCADCGAKYDQLKNLPQVHVGELLRELDAVTRELDKTMAMLAESERQREKVANDFDAYVNSGVAR